MKRMRCFSVFAICFAMFFCMTACDNGTTNSDDNSGSTGGTSVPGTPTGVSASAQSSSSIKVSWNSVSGANGYIVYRSSSASGTFTNIGTTTTASYTNTGLTTGTTYYYRVSAYNSVGESSKSTTVSAATSGSVPAKPSAPSLSLASATSITVSWTAVSGATGYKVYYNRGGTGSYTLLNSFTTASCTHSGLYADSVYYYKVCAYNSAGDGPQSDENHMWTTETYVTSALSSNIQSHLFYLNAGETHTFTRTLTASTSKSYSVFWYDKDYKDTYSSWYSSDNWADVQVGITRSGTNIVTMSDTGNAGQNTHSFKATTAGTYTITVQGISASSSKGVYGIQFYD